MGSPPSEKVVEAVADLEGREPLRLEPPLFRVIDPDALDALFQPTTSGRRTGGSVTFSYDGCEVTVGDDDLVRVRPSGGDGVFDDR